jgi:biotin carboxyl carrier protein
MDPKEDNVVTQLDYEGSPLPFKVKKTLLIKETDGAGALSDNVKSPMPGTVVKVFCKVGDKVVAG